MSFCTQEHTFWTNSSALQDFLRSHFVQHNYSFVSDQPAARGQQYVAFEVEAFNEDCEGFNLTGQMLNTLCYMGVVDSGVYVVEVSNAY